MPQDGTPIACPLAFGDGPYTVRIMRNTSGNNYVELCSADIDVALTSEFAPFLRPNVYCSYTASSSCVAKARELVEGCENQGDALRAICTYVVDNVAYDDDKAAKLKDSTGYIPDPDETLQSGKGVCFDYASLGAAMLRSQGIPGEDRHRHRLAAGHLPRLDHGEYRWHLAERPLQRFPKHLVAHRPDLCGYGRRGERRGRKATPTAMCTSSATSYPQPHGRNRNHRTAVEGVARKRPRSLRLRIASSTPVRPASRSTRAKTLATETPSPGA